MEYNYHTHTKRCGHASGSDEEYVQAAIQAGIKRLGFSDHIPYPGLVLREDRMNEEEFAGYRKSVHSLKKKYQDEIDILLAVEFEYHESYLDYLQEMKEVCDYLICGQHYKLMNFHDYGINCNDEDLEYYGNDVIKALDSGLADLLAHPDYFMLGRDNWSEACTIVSHRICQASVKYDVPLELNLNGLRYGRKEYDGQWHFPYPYRNFWEIASEYNCPSVYGYDAHEPLTLQEKWRVTEVNKIVAGLKLNIIDNFDVLRYKK